MRAQYGRLVFYSVILVTVKHWHCVGHAAASAEAEFMAGLVAAEAEADQDWKGRCISVGAVVVGSDPFTGYH